MRFNHLNLCVPNLDEAQSFFQDHFDFQLLDRKGDAIAILTDGEDFTLVLSKPSAFGSHELVSYPAGFHVGFIVDCADAVERVHARLLAHGILIDKAPRSIHGSYGFYFTALDGILFEVSCSRRDA